SAGGNEEAACGDPGRHVREEVDQGERGRPSVVQQDESLRADAAGRRRGRSPPSLDAIHPASDNSARRARRLINHKTPRALVSVLSTDFQILTDTRATGDGRLAAVLWAASPRRRSSIVW